MHISDLVILLKMENRLWEIPDLEDFEGELADLGNCSTCGEFWNFDGNMADLELKT